MPFVSLDSSRVLLCLRYKIKQVTGVTILVRTESVLHLSNQGIKKENSYRFFVMIN